MTKRRPGIDYHTEPGLSDDRYWFGGCSEQLKAQIRQRVSELYDGSRTIARCWRIALDEFGRFS